MWSQRTVLAIVLGLMAAGPAAAQQEGGLRWRGSAQPPLGLQAGATDFRVPCGSMAFACGGEPATVTLYGNRAATRALDMQVGPLHPTQAQRFLADSLQPQGLNASLVGKAGVAQHLGIYGRLGASYGRHPAFAGAAPGAEGSGLSYGIGLSWDFSPRGSAIVGWDSYDFRTVAGERDVRATSLGLHWRY